jgi:hypothetical protein
MTGWTIYDIEISLNTLFQKCDFFISRRTSVKIVFQTRERLSSELLKEFSLKVLAISGVQIR